MPKATVVDMTGKKVGEVELSEVIFGIEPNVAVVHSVVKNHLANCRQGPSPLSPAPRSPAAASSPGARRAPAVPVRVPPALPSGPTAAWSSLPSPVITATPSTRR